MAQPIAFDELDAVDGFGCPMKGGQPLFNMSSAPFSQASTAPPTPNLAAFPDLMDHMSPHKFGSGPHKFARTFSSGSTVVPESAPMTPLMSMQSDPSELAGREFSQRFGSFSSPMWGTSFSRMLSNESNFSSDYAEVDAPAFPTLCGSLTEEVMLFPERQDSDNASEDKVDELEELLAEIKDLYNQKYPTDYADDAGYESGRDGDGLAWVQYTGQGRDQVDQVQDLLDEVKGLYNSKYPGDHVDDENEMGHDEDGLTWVEYTGPGLPHTQVEKTEDLLDEVKGLYNAKYPCDHVDEADREMGYDADGLFWVKYLGQGGKTQEAQVDRIQALLDECKDLYNEAYPLDHVDDEDREVGTDEDGLLWVSYTAEPREEPQVGDLEDLLDEVKHLYNDKYPLDHVDAVGQEVGRDADGLLWVEHIGQGIETHNSKVEKLLVSLEEVKSMYNEKFPQDHVDDVNREVGVDADGLRWVKYTGHCKEAREAKTEEMFDLLDEVKHLYNESFPLDHVDISGCETGRDADGLLWVKYIGQGAESSKVEVLEDLLQEVKDLYNEKYPRDHVDDGNCEVGRDADGLLWVQYTGRGSEIRETKADDLLSLLEEVTGMYNERYPLDHVDDVGCSMGHDADGLLWVQHTGQGETRSSKIEKIEDLLDEVKGLYNQKYPHDHADDVGHEVGFDADGLLWSKYTGRAKVDDLQDLLEEVKGLYNEKYPLDHVDDVDREVGRDAAGLMWVKDSGHIERSQVERLEDLLEEVKGLYDESHPEDCVDDEGCEVGYDVDGLLWVKYTGQGVERSQVDKLGDLLEEVKSLYNVKYPDDHVDDEEHETGYDVDGLLWRKTTGRFTNHRAMKVNKLEDMLDEVKGLYNERYPQDHADDSDREVGTDADGLLWVRYTGQAVEPVSVGQHWATLCNNHLRMQQRRAVEPREHKVNKLDDLLQEVKGMYNNKYPLDHVDDMGHEVGMDDDGLLWVKHTGQGTESWERKIENLGDLLEEVKGMYNEKYPLDHVDDVYREVGQDSTGLLWVQYTGDGGRRTGQVQNLQDLLDEVKGMYSTRYPLDNVDEVDREVGYDADGLLWVKHIGQGLATLEPEEASQEPSGKSKVDKLQDMLNDVKRVYNDKYPLDHVDDLGQEVGYDDDGLLWVKHTGQGVCQ